VRSSEGKPSCNARHSLYRRLALAAATAADRGLPWPAEPPWLRGLWLRGLSELAERRAATGVITEPAEAPAAASLDGILNGEQRPGEPDASGVVGLSSAGTMA
jgi:hypothetical protein